MSEPRDERDGLSELLADALTAESLDPEPDLLLRYADDRASLAAPERERVEAYLAASPANRQQLRSLKRFADSQGGLTGTGPSEAQDVAGGGTVVPISSHPRWGSRAALVGTALAASLALALLYGTDAGPGPAVQVADDGTANKELLRAPDSEVPDYEALDPSAAAPQTQLAQIEEEVVAPAETAPPAQEAPLVPGPTRVLAEATPPPIATPEPEVLPDEVVTGEPIVIAMNFRGPLLYTPPGDAIALEALGGLRNTGPGLPTLQALAPAHVARTLSASPSLYWYVSEDTPRSVEFVLADRVSVDPLLELTLDSPLAAGIHALHLEEHDVVLEPGMEYRWFVTLSPVEGDPSKEIVTRGAIERISSSLELRARLDAAAPGELGSVYAANGLWYDALAFISEGIGREPEDARLRELRAELLEQAGLREAARHDRAATPNPTP